MKRLVFILFFCFFVLPAILYAGTVKLVTYYPPPTGAYNKIVDANAAVILVAEFLLKKECCF